MVEKVTLTKADVGVLDLTPRPVLYTCRGPFATVEALDAAGYPTLVTHPGGKRVGCGFNVSFVLAAVPRDGEEHVIECPKCKNTIHVSKPLPEPAPAPEK